MDARFPQPGDPGWEPQSTYWRPIPGTYGFEFGDAMEVRRPDYSYDTCTGETRLIGYVYMKHGMNAQGYPTVHIGTRRVALSQLVAFMAYGRWAEDGEIVRHLDDVKTNNYAGNLAYGTQRDNIRDSIRNGTHSSLRQGAWRRGVKINQRRRAS